MDSFERFRRHVQRHGFLVLLGENLLLIALVLAAVQYAHLPLLLAGGLAGAASIILNLLVVMLISNYAFVPLQALWNGILRLNPERNDLPEVQPVGPAVGQELVVNALAQLKQAAGVAEQAAAAARADAAAPQHNFVAQNLPLPLLILDAEETIVFANTAAAQYIGIDQADLVGKNVYMVLDMSFPSEDTFDTWLKTAKGNNATAVNTWERVRLGVRDDHPVRLFDLAAYYNRDNPNRLETMLTLFDHTKQYSQDDQAVSFMALSVHELRTPLTLLRGYIEVFEEELRTDDPELQGFMQKMHAMAEQLTAFVNNILNVARVDDDQLELQLQEEDWAVTLRSALESIALRAKVRGIQLRCTLQAGLPPVGIDRISITEVITNLVDNAIKYSGESKVIEIDTRLTQDGLVETTVRDYGLGISSSIMPNLFTKFYRDHRNRAQIGGTGLGLYLAKAIVTAHGGTIWVRSHLGEGSTFGFTIVPYAQLAEERKAGITGITRGAHGWIKNHSLYRR